MISSRRRSHMLPMNFRIPARRLQILGLLCLGIGALPVLGAPARAADLVPPLGWEEVQRSGEVIVYGRIRPGGSIRELRGIGTIDAPNWVVRNVLDDTEHYVDFMPNTLESHILSRDPEHHTLISYAKLSAPLISPRDYALLVHDESRTAADGSVAYKTRWEPAGSKSPAEKPGVTRIKINEGSWLLESIENGQKTRATYQLYSDGGGIPAILLNQVSKRRVGEVFEAVGKRARQPQYRKSKPVLP